MKNEKKIKIRKITLTPGTNTVKGGDPTGWHCHRPFSMCGPGGCITLCNEY